MGRRGRWVVAFALGFTACLRPPGDPAPARVPPPATPPPGSAAPPTAAPEAPTPPAAAAMDAGAPATTSRSESPLFGRESAADGGVLGDASAPPAAGAVNTRGSLDKEIVRRVIRSHIQEAKDCYEPQLQKRPGLGGRIQVQFTIAASGQVIASVLQSSTMDDARVENCIVQAVRGWQFPKPLHGLVIISYPFVLTPAKPAP